MNTNSGSPRRLFLGAIGLGSLVAYSYACSSSDPPAPAAPDAGLTPDANLAPDAKTPIVMVPGTTGNGGFQKVAQTNLFADTKNGGAANVDPNLVNSWGLAFNPSGIAWVSDNGKGLLTLYQPNKSTPLPLVVQVPLPGFVYQSDSGMVAAPTGMVFNASAAVPDAGPTNDFLGDLFIVATENGTIAGWQPLFGDQTKAALRDDMSGGKAIFKGLAIVPSSPQILIAADFHNGVIDTFATDYNLAPHANGKWVDPAVPAGFAPFNVFATPTNVFVAYAKQDARQKDDVAGAGNGAISMFDLTGTLVKTLIPQSATNLLNSPWGMNIVPMGGWGSLPAGTLVVGNFGDGTIHAFDANTGNPIAAFANSSGAPLVIDGLWALVWGPNAPEAGASPEQLFFTAGPNHEMNGLFGFLTAQ